MHLIHKLLNRVFMNEAGDGTTGGAGAPAADRGDDFTPSETSPAQPAQAETSQAQPEQAETSPAQPEQAETKPAETKQAESPMIPKARLDEVLAKNRELAAQLQQRQQQQAQQADLSALTTKKAELYAKYEEALMDGDAKLAADLRGELLTVDEQVMGARLEQAQQQAVQTVQAQQAYAQTIAAVEADFPALNPDSEAYDAALEEEVADLMNAYATTGLSAPQALAKAVQMVTAAKGIEPASRAAAAPAPTPVDPAAAAAAKIAAAEQAAQARKGEAVARNVAAAQAQPPSTENVGLAGSTGLAKQVDVSRMSEREFDKLRKDADALAVARGDVL